MRAATRDRSGAAALAPSVSTAMTRNVSRVRAHRATRSPPRAGSSMTLADYLIWPVAAGQGSDARTVDARPRHCSAVELYLLPHLGDIPLRRLRREYFRSLYQRLLIAGSRNGGPLAAKTIHNLHQLIHAALRDAVNDGLATRESGRGRARAGPSPPAVGSSAGSVVDRRRARRVPRRHRRESPCDVVPAGRGDWDAPR